MPPISNSLGNISAPGTGAPIGGSAGPIGGTPIGGGSLGGTPIGGAAGPIGGGIGAIGGGAGAVGAGAIGSTGGSAGGMKPGPMGMPAMMQGLQNNPAPNPAAVGVSKNLYGHECLSVSFRPSASLYSVCTWQPLSG